MRSSLVNRPVSHDPRHPSALRRRVAAALVGIGLLVPLSACGSEGGSDASSPAAETSTAASPAAPADESPSSESSAPTDEAAAETFSYEGRDGATALELLQEADPSAEVSGSGEMAFVTGIDGRTADSAANEFWALYVNGEMAEVGAGSLVTKTGDTIEWKLETFS